MMMIPRTPLHEEPLQNDNSSNDDCNDRYNNIVCGGKKTTPADEQQQLRQMNMKRTRSRLGARSSHSLYASSSSSLLFIAALLLLFSTSNCSQAASLSSIHDKTNLQDSNKNDIAAPDSINSSMTLMASSVSSPPSPTKNKPTAQQIFEANSICTQMTQSPHQMNTHLRNQPLLSSGCRKYISCDTTTATNKGS
eukprot:scaffold19951_cov142-Skeletonema_dohrnii-CCMP3373.AAC.7